jgi:murein DD-endopeptidase MepM/ murein hydrolase activator NlpD
MNITDGIAFKRKQVAKLVEIETEAIKLGAFSFVSSISEAIETKDDIKTRRAATTVFQKLAHAARTVMAQEAATVDLTEQEKAVTDRIGKMVVSGVKSVVRHIAKAAYTLFFRAVRYAIVPIFRLFTMAVTAAFRIVLTNPVVAAGAAVALAAGLGYKWYKDRDADMRGPKGTDLPGTPIDKDTDRTVAEARTAPRKELASGATDKPTEQVTEQAQPTVKQIVVDAAKRHNVPVSLATKMAGAESSFKADAKAKTSSAKGLFQFTDTTWEEHGGEAGKQLDPVKNADMGARYIANNISILKKRLGRDPLYYEVYALHFFGPASWPLFQNPNLRDPIEKGLAKFKTQLGIARVLKANPFLKGKTIGDLFAWLESKVGKVTIGDGLKESEDIRVPLITAAPKVVAEYTAKGQFIIPASGTYVSPFGQRGDKYHEGIDIANAIGTPIYAADGGVVTVSRTLSMGYGTRIDIDHGNGFTTRYGHSSKLLVNVGDKVRRGQQIAEMGNQGHSSGPHLHFEVIKQTAKVDPASYLPSSFPVVKNSVITQNMVASSMSAPSNTVVRVGDKLITVRG